MSELPKGWTNGSLSELIPHDGVISDGDWVESKDQDPDGKVRLIQLADIGDGDFKNKSQRFMTEDSAERLNCSFLKSGDLLIARMPDPLGRACIFPGVRQKAVTVVDVCFIRGSELSAISNSLLRYWINSPKIRNLIASNSSGSTRKRITRKNLERFTFPIPPQAEQTRIVEKLDEVLAQVDAIKSRLDSIPAILKRFRQSVLAAAVSGRLTKEWRSRNKKEPSKVVQLGSVISDINQGWSPKCENNSAPEGKWAVIKTSSVQKIDFLSFENKQLPDDLEPRPELVINVGDIIVTRAGPRVRCGVTAYVENTRSRLMLCDKVYRFTVKAEEGVSKYLALILNSPQYLEEIEEMKTGSSDSGMNLTQKKFRELSVTWPSVEEQKEIVRLVEQYFVFADTIEAQVKKAQTRVDNLTQSILAKAFRGELVAQDPSDEPAEKLLERIAQARKEAEALAKAAKKVAKTK